MPDLNIGKRLSPDADALEFGHPEPGSERRSYHWKDSRSHAYDRATHHVDRHWVLPCQDKTDGTGLAAAGAIPFHPYHGIHDGEPGLKQAR